jgi:hypothetical protein
MTANRTATRVWEYLKLFLEQRHLHLVLAIGAILVMLPALKTGLFLDDLPQRALELRPGQLPPRMHETGNPADSGSLPTVLRDLYFNRTPQDMAAMKNYGMLPWWTADNLRLGLWRPLSAFTLWLDYRLFPDSPALMHAHNIAWFAAIVLVLTLVYRRLMGPGWVAGLAAVLYLLDGNTYFPVAFIANRAFMMALFFGLMCLYEHHQWRSTKSCFAGALAALFLALSLFANEGGASTFAFILAYALVLEPGPWRRRALTILPAVLVIVLWRTIYEAEGFGLQNVGLYIDPAHEPLRFAQEVIPRAIILLAGQVPFLSPDVLFAVNPAMLPAVKAFYCASLIAALAVMLPWIRRNKMAAFWFTVMLLAVIPAATVAQTSKNLGFVAVGAYGLIASFVAALCSRPCPLPTSRLYRIPAWTACALLLLMHVPGAIIGRVFAADAVYVASQKMPYFINVANPPDAENRNVIVVNAPCPHALAFAPAYKAYHHLPLPKTMRTLLPASTSFDVKRTDDKTLLIQSHGPDIFSCDDMGALNAAYALSALDLCLCEPKCKKGGRYDLGGLTVEVLESDASNLASQVAFRFNTSLDSPEYVWLWFDWRTAFYQPFKIPAIGQSVTLSGPAR